MSRCSAYAYRKGDPREYCTRGAGHEGAHAIEYAGPGAWWMSEAYDLDDAGSRW